MQKLYFFMSQKGQVEGEVLLVWKHICSYHRGSSLFTWLEKGQGR